jgi:hypothetical protein
LQSNSYQNTLKERPHKVGVLNVQWCTKYNIFSIIYIICQLAAKKLLTVALQTVNVTIKKLGVKELLNQNALKVPENAEIINVIKKYPLALKICKYVFFIFLL